MVSSPRLHVALPLSMHRERDAALWFSSYKDTNPIDHGPTLRTLFNLNYFLRGSTSKHNHTRGEGFNI